MDDTMFLGKEISILSNKMNRMINNNICKYGITSIQGKIIGYIYSESTKRDIFQKDIEKEFDIRGSSVTSVLNLLQKKEFIKRISSSKDGRLKKIILTDKGIKVHMEAFKAILEIERTIQNVLSEDEAILFFDIIRRLNSNIKS